MELHGTAARLFVRQLIAVVDGHCQTESYSYRLQAPPAHVHVNGEFPDGSAAGRLHIPTRRIPLELVAWYLIADGGIETKTEQCVPTGGIAGAMATTST